ncbi:hypothetical protein C2W62_20975 [Candidatus Entotheonella serta]|nr:hypothetical protein C2W62_20975 [Candidatus Entotheonella serta]
MSTITIPLRSPLTAIFVPLQACEDLAATCGMQPEVVPADFMHRSSQHSQNPLDLVSYAWTSETIYRMRLTEIFGPPGTHIVNIGIFPHVTSILPLMQLELLVIKQRLLLLIIDALLPPTLYWSLDTESPSQALQRLATTYNTLPLTNKRDEWTQFVISNDAIWSRPNTTEAITPACEAVIAFFAWCATIIRTDQGQRLSADQTAQRICFMHRFRTIWLDNEPSRPYLSSMFGAEWAERYMSEFLFGHQEACDKGSAR